MHEKNVCSVAIVEDEPDLVMMYQLLFKKRQIPISLSSSFSPDSSL